MTIDQIIARHGAAHVYQQLDITPGVSGRMVALGLPEPRSLLDVWRAGNRAFDALSPAERETDRRETEAALALIARGARR
jgi:hypothetical protein